MKKLFIATFALGITAGIFAQEAPGKFNFKLDFETALKRGYAPKPYSKLFINPTKDIKWDGTGTAAHSGKGSVSLPASGSITMDCYTLEAGKTYTMALWAKADKPGVPVSIRFLWFNKDNKVFRTDARSAKLPGTEWQKITRTVKAPECRHVYFVITGGTPTEPVWIDDFSVTED